MNHGLSDKQTSKQDGEHHSMHARDNTYTKESEALGKKRLLIFLVRANYIELDGTMHSVHVYMHV